MSDGFDDYIECALWSSRDIGPDGEEILLDEWDGDLSEQAMTYLRTEYDDFMAQPRVRELIEQTGMSIGQAAHDFWLTRNGHGAGFWDRGHGAAGDELSDLCKPYGEVNLYIGDDGRIHSQ